jgi:mono/diheme cytochrome c family protein
MKTPFQPQLVGAPLPGAAQAKKAPASPLAIAGRKIFESHGCFACHGEGAVGTAIAPRIIGIGNKFSEEQMENLFQHPTAKMSAGGMPHFQFTPNDVKALRAYLDSLQ